jgi:hypothetical protein
MRGPSKSLIVRDDLPLIGVIVREDGEDVTHYFVDETEAEVAVPDSVQRALSLAGAWADMDWNSALEELERIGHESPPTPPIEL